MFLVDEKMGAVAVDEEEDEVSLVFWRLGCGAVAALLVPVVVSVSLVDILRGFSRGFDFRTDFLLEKATVIGNTHIPFSCFVVIFYLSLLLLL